MDVKGARALAARLEQTLYEEAYARLVGALAAYSANPDEQTLAEWRRAERALEVVARRLPEASEH